mmetsp:Transcript_6653/g.5762  ORF Transcript_6653/g.5762 Transcript_6653/m.5762 type:complete len:89 (-) Transcript_6653:338-604(-)
MIDSSEPMSPMIGSMANSIVERVNSSNYKSSTKMIPMGSPMPRKSALKQVNFSSKNLHEDEVTVKEFDDEDYDKIRENRQRLLKTAKA